MGAVRHFDPLVVDEQVRMVIDRLGGKTQAHDESDRLGKARERELPADDLAFGSPLRQICHSSTDLRPGNLWHAAEHMSAAETFRVDYRLNNVKILNSVQRCNSLREGVDWA